MKVKPVDKRWADASEIFKVNSVIGCYNFVYDFTPRSFRKNLIKVIRASAFNHLHRLREL